MSGRVIQGFFLGGQARPVPGPSQFAVQRKAATTHAPANSHVGPPPPAFAAAGNPVQRFGGENGGFAVDPVQLGLARGGGQPLPQALLAKMEAAFNSDFSAVRVHVGQQAARIGAIAFTTGNDLYFAPGRYQPDSVQGQQLIGHELAHVIQQRQGRVRAPGSGVAVVQDHALEAEADRLGAKAAAHLMASPKRVQLKRQGPPAISRGAIQRSRPAFHRTSSFDLSSDDQNQIKTAEKIVLRCLTQGYNDIAKSINDYKKTGNDSMARKLIAGYPVVTTSPGAPARFFSRFVGIYDGTGTVPLNCNMATSLGTAVGENAYYYLNGHTSSMMGNLALESPKPVTLQSGDVLSVDYSKISGGTRPDVRICLPTKGEGVFDFTSSTAKVNHTSTRGWQNEAEVRYIAEMVYPGTTNADLFDPNHAMPMM